MIEWSLFRLGPKMIDVYTYEGVYGNGSILISPYLAVWSAGMLVGSSKPMGLCLS